MIWLYMVYIFEETMEFFLTRFYNIRLKEEKTHTS